jgi:hypothetical protein
MRILLDECTPRPLKRELTNYEVFEEQDLLTLRRIYQVIKDENAAKSNYLRVIDNEEEDYLYPADYFIRVEFPKEVEKVGLNSSHDRLFLSPLYHLCTFWAILS